MCSLNQNFKIHSITYALMAKYRIHIHVYPCWKTCLPLEPASYYWSLYRDCLPARIQHHSVVTCNINAQYFEFNIQIPFFFLYLCWELRIHFQMDYNLAQCTCMYIASLAWRFAPIAELDLHVTDA